MRQDGRDCVCQAASYIGVRPNNTVRCILANPTALIKGTVVPVRASLPAKSGIPERSTWVRHSGRKAIGVEGSVKEACQA